MSYAGMLGLSVKCAGGRVSIGVSDNGPGIPEGIRARVFDLFFTTKRQGLGLNICRMIVEKSGGDIRFETGPRVTAFFVSLPEAASLRTEPRFVAVDRMRIHVRSDVRADLGSLRVAVMT